MINIALTSEFNFQKTFAKLEDVVKSQARVVSIADNDNTFCHYKLQQFCDKHGKKPIFGVRVMAVRAPEEKVRPRGQFGPIYIVLAKNHEGLQEIYRLVQRSTECFYYRNHVGLIDIWSLSENVIVISDCFEIDERVDYLGVSFNTPRALLKNCKLPRVALNIPKYLSAQDKDVYELLAGAKRERPTYPGHLLSEREWMSYFNDAEAVANTYRIADQCDVRLIKAELVKHDGEETMEDLCELGAKELGVDLNDPVYRERYEHELVMVRDKGFEDYFLIVSEMVRFAKQFMLVGPGRGSSGGSLICYLMKITTVDPIKHRLIFQRFISPQRTDLPDIDIDFPDRYRKMVIKHLSDKYGESRVRMVANISQMKVKGTLREFAKQLSVPQYLVDDVNASMIKRSSADIRYNYCIEDTLMSTESGRQLLQNYPAMKLCANVENHARTHGVHAAGVIVATDALWKFASVNERNNSIMLEKRDADYMNLLKIDCLGLTTLTILQDTADAAGFDFRKFYDLPLDDDPSFKVFRDLRLRGIFQFEGNALQNLCRGMKVKHIEDIIAITALARPGPLHGGSARLYVDCHNGDAEPELLINHPIMESLTGFTFGAIVFQEQLMEILRVVGDMSWEEVEEVRKVVSKRAGKEKFNSYRAKFVEGALAKGMDKAELYDAWEKMLNFGAYGFNRAHAVAYGFLSYWTAWAKTHYPTEFLLAYLNNTASTESCIKILREMKESDGVKYVAIDPDVSEDKWIIKDGVLIGPLTNIKGIGVSVAKRIMKARKDGVLPAKSTILKLTTARTEYDTLYPCREYWGGLFDDPELYGLSKPPTLICDINHKGQFIFVGKLVKKNVRDLNEALNVQKRGGEIYTEDTFLMNLTLEDDTDTIMARIGRKDFATMAPEIIDNSKEGIDWFLIKGNMIADDIRFIFIKEIHRLGDGINERL